MNEQMVSDPMTAADGSELHAAQAWIFDLDNTLYPPSIDLFGQIDERMRDYIASYLGLHPEEAYRIQKRYFFDYGTSLRGLMRVHGMDPAPFLEHVHDIDVTILPPSPQLETALAALPGRKLVYTNASTRHAERVMDRLGIAHHFEAVFDIVEAGYEPKPEPRPYSSLVRRFGFDPEAAVMVEDMARNLVPAAALGMTTVWVRSHSERGRAGLDGARIDHETDDLAGWLESLLAAHK